MLPLSIDSNNNNNNKRSHQTLTVVVNDEGLWCRHQNTRKTEVFVAEQLQNRNLKYNTYGKVEYEEDNLY